MTWQSMSKNYAYTMLSTTEDRLKYLDNSLKSTPPKLYAAEPSDVCYLYACYCPNKHLEEVLWARERDVQNSITFNVFSELLFKLENTWDRCVEIVCV